MRSRLPVALVVLVNAFLSVVATYAVLRAYDVLFKNEPDPAEVAWSIHIAMFWRLGIGVFVAGMLAAPIHVIASRNLALATRATAVMVPMVGALIAIQGVLFP